MKAFSYTATYAPDWTRAFQAEERPDGGLEVSVYSDNVFGSHWTVIILPEDRAEFIARLSGTDTKTPSRFTEV